jgi:hypothetical protein
VRLDLAQRLQPTALVPRLGEKRGALHCEPDLLRHRLQHPHLLRVEGAPVSDQERHCAPDPVLEGDRQRDLREDGSPRRQLAQRAAAHRRGVDQGDVDASGSHRLPHVGPLQRPHAQRDRVGHVETAMRDEDESVDRGILAEDAAHPHPGQPEHHVQGIARGGLEIGAAADGGRDRVEGLQLAVAPGQGFEGGIRHRVAQSIARVSI